MKKYKIHLNRVPVSGPWGGGTKFVAAIRDRLMSMGHTVCHKIEPGIDRFICFDPRHSDAGESILDILRYRDMYNTYTSRYTTSTSTPECRILMRVGDVGSHGKEHLTSLLLSCVYLVDDVVFPSRWAYDYLVDSISRLNAPPDLRQNIRTAYDNLQFSIIENRPHAVFYEHRNMMTADELHAELRNRKLRVVTHHWSTNPMKGFEHYKLLDARDDIDFTYIGRVPDGVKFRNHIEPQSSESLAKILPTHDVYFTASRREAGANHVLEAMAAGLPVVYSDDGGSICEYCSSRGQPYVHDDQETIYDAIRHVVDDYETYKTNVLRFDYTIQQAVDSYIDMLRLD